MGVAQNVPDGIRHGDEQVRDHRVIAVSAHQFAAGPPLLLQVLPAGIIQVRVGG